MHVLLALFLASSAVEAPTDRYRDAVTQASTREVAGKTYESFFTRQPHNRIKSLREDPDTGIALQAAWEASHRPVKRHDKYTGWDWLYDPAGSQQFLDFFKARTSLPIPAWWSATILKTEMAPGLGSACFGPCGKGARAIVLKGDRATITQRGNTFHIPTSDIVGPGGYVAVDATLESTNAYVAIIPPTGVGELYCFNRSDGKLVWKSEVWATGRNAVNGVVLEGVSVIRKGDAVAVFGAGSAYAEAFDSKTGKPRFRFSTSYWEHWSEAWKWPVKPSA